MLRLQQIAVTAVLALALASPALAQRGQGGGQGGGGRGTGPRPDGGAGRTQPRDSASVVDRMLSTGRPGAPNTRTGSGVPTLPGLESASLIGPRPGGDVFRASPQTYGRPGGIIVPRGPSWGGVPVGPSVPSWGGTPIHGSEHGKRDGDRDNRGSRHGSRRQFRGGYGYAGGYAAVYGLPYGYVPYDINQPVVAGQPAAAELPEGFLRLLVTPRDADVIVDGVLAGSVDDFGGTGERALPAGPHRIRIEAPGYEPVEFDVRVPIGDTISLRRELNPLPAPRPAPPATPERGVPNAPGAGKTFYAIPRCYLGNTRPK